MDKVAGETQPDSQKSTGQSAFDKGNCEKDGTFLDNVKLQLWTYIFENKFWFCCRIFLAWTNTRASIATSRWVELKDGYGRDENENNYKNILPSKKNNISPCPEKF